MKPGAGVGRRQRGVVLLVLILMLFTVTTTVFLSSVNTHSVEVRQHNDVRIELEKARQNLMAYALNFPEYQIDHDGDTYTDDAGPGRFLCPDIDNDGLADNDASDCTDYVRGRLPERFSYGTSTITVSTLNDAFANIDQQFWYVVSPAFKQIASSDVNNTTTGDLSIDGVGGYVAVLIAPGEALSTQNRASSATTVSNYLEQDNISGTSFINLYNANPSAFNDQVIGIKDSELQEQLNRIRQGVLDNSPVDIYEPIRDAQAEYWLDTSSIISNIPELSFYMQDKGYGWMVDEGYLDNALTNFTYSPGYPYINYRLDGCTSLTYWFIPDYFSYNYNNTYTSGAPC